MPLFDEETAKKKRAHEIGEDLASLSVDELGVPVENDEILEVLNLGSKVIEWDSWTKAIEDQLGAE